MQNIFFESEIKDASPNSAGFHIIPVPYEKSVSYGKGTANAPAAIISASNQLETYDQIHGEPCSYGIYTAPAIDCRGEASQVLQRVRNATKEAVKNGAIPFVLGGEHTVSYGAVMGVVDANPRDKIGIVHFDAHADLRENYEGSIWSHACVMKRLADEELPIYQIGVRAISFEEIATRDLLPEQIKFQDAKTLCRPTNTHKITLPENFPQKIYISVDIDVLDGMLFPATGTPVAGGLQFWQLIDLLESVCEGRKTVGMDLVEFAPNGIHAYDFAAADLAYKMMGIAYRGEFFQ